MKHLRLAAAVVAIVTTLPALADDDFAAKAINTPADSFGVWGSAKMDIVVDSKAPGSIVRRVTISPMPTSPWDIGGYVLITKPVKKGDVLLLAFWARAKTPPAGDDFIQTHGRIYEKDPPNTGVTPETTFLVGRDWKLHYASGVAAKDYAVGTLNCSIVLGTGEQTIEFGPATIADFGPGYDMTKLPAEQ